MMDCWPLGVVTVTYCWLTRIGKALQVEHGVAAQSQYGRRKLAAAVAYFCLVAPAGKVFTTV